MSERKIYLNQSKDSIGIGYAETVRAEQVPPHVMQQVNGYTISHENRRGSDTLDWLKSIASSKSTYINIVKIDQSGASIGVGYAEQVRAKHIGGTINNDKEFLL